MALAGLLALSAAGLGALFLVVTSAGAAAGRLPPRDHELAMRLLKFQAISPDYRISGKDLEMMRSAATAAPLAYEPFFVAGRAKEQAGRMPEALALMEEARRRRPNYTPIRVNLMGYYAQGARYREAIGEADVVMRLSPEASASLVPVLADMLPHAEARAAFAAILLREPSWREAFLDAARKKTRPEHAAALLAELSRLKGGSISVPEASLVVATLIREGRYGEAHAAWLRLVPVRERGRSSLLFDADFQGLTAPPPFNWTFNSNQIGRAEPVASGSGEPSHLDVGYFGGGQARLAEQMLVLKPGSYQLTIKAKADRSEPQGEIYWALTCQPGARELARLPFTKFSNSYGMYRMNFAVPAACPAQVLALIAEPGDLSQPINIAFAQLRLEPAR